MLENAGTLSTRRSFVKTQSTQRPRTSDFLSWLAAAGRKAVGLALELRPGIGLVGPCNDTLCAKKCSPSGQFTIHNSQIFNSTTTLRMNTSPPSVPSFPNRNAFGATDATPSFPLFLSCLLVLFVLFRALDRRHTKCLGGMVHALVCRYETGGGYVKYQHGVPVHVAISPTYIEHRVTETAS